MIPELQAFLDSEAGLGLKAALVAMFADWITGTIAALRDGTFSMDVLAAFLRKHGARVSTLASLLALGYFGGPAGVIFLPPALAGLAAYAAETASSILGNLNPPKDSDRKEVSAAAKLNPVPQD